MADPNKFKSVSVPIKTCRKLEFLGKDKTFEILASWEANNKMVYRG